MNEMNFCVRETNEFYNLKLNTRLKSSFKFTAKINNKSQNNNFFNSNHKIKRRKRFKFILLNFDTVAVMFLMNLNTL